MSESIFPYIHGFSQTEQDRLRYSASLAEFDIYKSVDFSEAKKVLEVGCGVGAQTEILLRRFPKLQLSSIDMNEKQIAAAKGHLEKLNQFKGRFTIQKMDAKNLDFESSSFDGAFLCWVVEHVPEPIRVLNEVRRVLSPGASIYVTEVMNSTFFLDPYSPNVWKYWMAFNDFQYDQAGDPFVGVKLGNYLTQVGFQNVQTKIKTWHYDNRNPGKRKVMIDFWTDLLLSAADELTKAKYVDAETVSKAKEELDHVARDPNAIFYFSFMQAKAMRGI